MRGIKVFILSLLIVVPVQAQNLSDLVAIAKTNNPELMAAKKTWQASRARITKDSTWQDPKFELMYEQVPGLRGSFDDASMKMYGLSQMIPFPGKLTLKRWLADDAARMTEQKYLASLRSVVAKLKTTYYSLYFVDQSIRINEENKALLQNFAKIAEAKYVVGKASQHDVLKAQIEFSLLDNELITLRQKRQTVQARLNALLNRESRASLEVEVNLNLADVNFSLVSLEAIALGQRPDLKATEYGFLMSQKATTLAKAAYLPDFSLKALRREMKTTGLNGWNVVFMADLPLWFWREAAGVSEAAAIEAAAKAAYLNMKNMVRFEVHDAFVKVDTAQRLTKLFKTSIVPKAKQALQAATRAYKSNKVDFLTLINSQKMLLNAKLQYFRARADFGTSLADLEQVIGGEIK